MLLVSNKKFALSLYDIQSLGKLGNIVIHVPMFIIEGRSLFEIVLCINIYWIIVSLYILVGTSKMIGFIVYWSYAFSQSSLSQN